MHTPAYHLVSGSLLWEQAFGTWPWGGVSAASRGILLAGPGGCVLDPVEDYRVWHLLWASWQGAAECSAEHVGPAGTHWEGRRGP